MSLKADLKALRQQVEKLQVEVNGREAINSMVVWERQNQDSVNSESSRIREDFSGLVVHLTEEVSPRMGTVGLGKTDFERLKEQIRAGLD